MLAAAASWRRGGQLCLAGAVSAGRDPHAWRRVRWASATRPGALSTPAEASEDAFVS